jgi:hypothetical protein
MPKERQSETRDTAEKSKIGDIFVTRKKRTFLTDSKDRKPANPSLQLQSNVG